MSRDRDLDAIIANEARLALIDRLRKLEAVVAIVRVRARFADSNGWPAMHPRSPEEVALDAALAALDTSGSAATEMGLS